MTPFFVLCVSAGWPNPDVYWRCHDAISTNWLQKFKVYLQRIASQMFSCLFFSILNIRSPSPLFLLVEVLLEEGLRPRAFLPLPWPFLGPATIEEWSPSSSSGPKSWGNSKLAGWTVTVFPSSRWISMLAVINRSGGRRSSQDVSPWHNKFRNIVK